MGSLQWMELIIVDHRELELELFLQRESPPAASAWHGDCILYFYVL